MRKAFKLLPLVAALALTGCMSMAPSYERPEAPIVTAWPSGEAYADAKLNQQALPDWHEFFTDERLRKVIQMTLDNNRDYRVQCSMFRECVMPTTFSALNFCRLSPATEPANTAARPEH